MIDIAPIRMLRMVMLKMVYHIRAIHLCLTAINYGAHFCNPLYKERRLHMFTFAFLGFDSKIYCAQSQTIGDLSYSRLPNPPIFRKKVLYFV